MGASWNNERRRLLKPEVIAPSWQFGFSGGTAFDGSWHSVAFRRNGTAFAIFVDGVSVASTTATLATGSTCNRTSLMHIIQQRNDRIR